MRFQRIWMIWPTRIPHVLFNFKSSGLWDESHSSRACYQALNTLATRKCRTNTSHTNFIKEVFASGMIYPKLKITLCSLGGAQRIHDFRSRDQESGSRFFYYDVYVWLSLKKVTQILNRESLPTKTPQVKCEGSVLKTTNELAKPNEMKVTMTMIIRKLITPVINLFFVTLMFSWPMFS